MWTTFSDEESEAVQDLYKNSDRGAAIMAAALVETRLAASLTHRFRQNTGSVQKEMFRSSGPLGSFSAKIKLAYLLGALTEEGYSDLETMKSIRNRFAHHLDIKDFNSQRIADWCKNFRLIEVCVYPPGTKEPSVKRLPGDWFTVPDYAEKMKSPKWRYLLTAMLLSGALGVSRPSGIPNI